tara:strand:- start:2096 stop:2536 length:441 start_codon:yes stop_codon:yes gene_type:complete
MLKKNKGFIKYNCTAILAAFSDWVTFLILHWLGIFFVYNQMIARLVGGATSFILNKNWSFETPGKSSFLLHGRRFVALFIFSYFLSNLFLYFFVQWLKLPVFGAKLVADSICYITNFFIMKDYIFNADRSISRSLRDFMIDCWKSG